MYGKKIYSMAALEAEKRKLIKQRVQMEEEGLVQIDELMEEAGSSLDIVSKIPFVSGIVSKVMPLAGTFGGPVMGLVQDWLSRRADDSDAPSDNSRQKGPAPGKKVKDTLLTAGKDVLISYLKWKAIELSYKGVSRLVKTQKEKKAAKK